MKLSIPYMSQQDNTIRNDCGPACAAMLINSYTSQVVTIENYYEDHEPGGLQGAHDLMEFMSDFGISSSWVTGSTFRNVQAWIDAKKPAIALIWYKPLVDAGYTYYKSGEFTHFVVIVGATDTDVIIHDPYFPPDHPGENISIKKIVFSEAWYSVPAIYGPQGGAILPDEPLGEQMTYYPGDYKCIANFLNVRSGPGTNYPIVGSLHMGDIVTIVEVLGNWGRFDGDKWASLSYMTEIESPPPTDLVIHITKTGENTYTVILPQGVTIEYQ